MTALAIVTRALVILKDTRARALAGNSVFWNYREKPASNMSKVSATSE